MWLKARVYFTGVKMIFKNIINWLTGKDCGYGNESTTTINGKKYCTECMYEVQNEI